MVNPMPEISRESIDCKVFDKSHDAYNHGKCGIHYRYDDHGGQHPLSKPAVRSDMVGRRNEEDGLVQHGRVDC